LGALIFSSSSMAGIVGNIATSEGTTYVQDTVNTTLNITGYNYPAPLPENSIVFDISAISTGGADAVLVWANDEYVDDNGYTVAKDANGKKWPLLFSINDFTCSNGVVSYKNVNNQVLDVGYNDEVTSCEGLNGTATLNVHARNSQEWPAGSYTLKLFAVGWID
ncbi:hypothetical protein, partial [Escherichia coli]